MSEDKKTFVVKDRRWFASESADSDENEVREKEEIEKNELEQPPDDAESEAQAISENQKAQQKESSRETHFPKINFQTFILSLNSSALVQLGLIEDPVSGLMEKNLSLAKQTIDMMGMLEEKTRGNLAKDEEMMLKNILYELRIMYVRESS